MPTLYEFLCRPYPIKFGTWTSARNFGELLYSIDLPRDLCSVQAIWEKMIKFTYWRGGFRIGMRINGTRFHYGKLLLVWYPYPSEQWFDSYANMVSGSAFPHVILSPTMNEVRELVVPYAYPLNYIPLEFISSNTAIPVGRVCCYVLNPLHEATNVNAVNYTVYVNFEDITLDGPTYNTWPAPSLSTNVTLPTPSPSYNLGDTSTSQGGIASYINYDIKAQIGEMEPEISKEAVNKSKGVISGALSTVPKVISAIKPIVLDSLGSVSRITSNLSRVALEFGFCKPNTLLPDVNFVPKIFNLAYGTGLDTAHKLSVNPENSVKQAPYVMGSSEDEMNMLSIFQTPSYIGSFVWEVSATDGTQIGLFPISPFFVNISKPTSNWGQYLITDSVLAFAARPFMYWRGSIRYSIQLVASSFHSGRIRVSYLPLSLTILPESETAYASCPNRVLDLQTESTLDVVFPFLYATHWCNQQEILGYLRFDVINPLTHPGEIVPPVYINIWISGGDDFQVAWPYQEGLHMVSINQLTPPSVSTGIKAQGLTRSETKNGKYENIMPASLYRDEGICHGEHIESLKEIICRPSNYIWAQLETAINSVFLNTYNPIYMSESTNLTFLEWYKLIFRFSRGSTSVKFLSLYSVPANYWAVLFGDQITFPGNSKLPSTIPTGVEILNSIGNGCEVISTPTSSNLEFTIPYYTRFNCIPTRIANGVAGSYTIELPPLAGIFSTSTFTQYFLYVYAGDDFALGFLHGPPIVGKNTYYAEGGAVVG